jgi:hypothetical protein
MLILMIIMTTTLPNPVASEVAEVSFGALFLEPLMVIGSVLFWAVVLPLAAILRLSVGTYDAVTSVLAKTRQLEGLGNCRANPLVLRRGATESQKPALTTEVLRQSA